MALERSLKTPPHVSRRARATCASLVLTLAGVLTACGDHSGLSTTTTTSTPLGIRSPAAQFAKQPRAEQLRVAHLCLQRRAAVAGAQADARTSDVKRGQTLRTQATQAVLAYGDEQARTKLLAAISVSSPSAAIQSLCDDLGEAFAAAARPPAVDIAVAGADSDLSFGDFAAFKSGSKSPTASIKVTFKTDAPSPQVRVEERTTPKHYESVGGTAKANDDTVTVRVALSGEAPTFRVLASARPGGAEARQDITIERPAGAQNASGGTVPASPPSRRQQVRRLLEQKQAVGLTQQEVRAALGRPAQTQDVGDSLYWYYDTSANSYQVVIVDGRTADVNRYGKLK
jgi:hypothetical protein